MLFCDHVAPLSVHYHIGFVGFAFFSAVHRLCCGQSEVKGSKKVQYISVCLGGGVFCYLSSHAFLSHLNRPRTYCCDTYTHALSHVPIYGSSQT